MSRRSRRSNEEAPGCLIYALLLLYLMPVVGLFLMFSSDAEKRKFGTILFIVGVLIWLVIKLPK